MKTRIITIIATLCIALMSSAQQIGDGLSLEITDFSTALKSGTYQGLSPIGMNPDVSYGGWQHLFVVRHSNLENNHQLQLSSTYTENDRLFFRKKAASVNPSWIELATRGTNNFIGNQNISGNLGIGTSPTAKLETLNATAGITSFKTVGVNGYLSVDNVGSGENYYSANNFHEFQIAGVSKMRINPNGNIGIGTPAPSFYQHGGNNKVLEVYNPNTTVNSQSHLILSTGSILPNSYLGSLTWSMPNMSASNKGLAYLGVISGTNSTSANPSSSMIFATRNAAHSNWNPNMVLSDTGNLGIGILTPNNKLDVNGTIHSKEVKVDMTGWSDFVFKKEYHLPTLEEVEKHIKEKGHLENIPSEKEVLENGINLGEMNAKLLQKIEELTLYSIDQNKKIESQAKEIEALKDLVLRVSKLESELARK